MRIAYFDCYSGISGDMCLGSLIDAGAPLKEIEKTLKRIPIGGYRLSLTKVRRGSLTASNLNVVQETKSRGKSPELRRWKDIEEIVISSSLAPDIKEKGLRIFKRLFKAESEVHGVPFQETHLHELGAVDCIVDIFGTVIALNVLGIERIFSSPINLGGGFVKTQHGLLPAPAPATSRILAKVPVYSKGISEELTTPTGAAIIKELSKAFGDLPPMTVDGVGIGAGDKDFKDWPNTLRVFIGEAFDTKVGWKSRASRDTVTVIETNIDDMNPQVFEYVLESLLKAGALDAWLTQIIMKKGRPAVKLTVLCHDRSRDALIDILFEETTTIGVRFYEAARKTLARVIETIETEFGKVRVKRSMAGTKILKTTLEYEDCKKLAKRLNIPLIEIMKKIR